MCITAMINHIYLQNLTMLWRNSLSVTGQKHKKLTLNCFYDKKLSNCPLSLVTAHLINYKSVCLSAYWRWKLTNNRARISAVIVEILFDEPWNAWSGLKKTKLDEGSRMTSDLVETFSGLSFSFLCRSFVKSLQCFCTTSSWPRLLGC